jgi:hypothetical protein
MTVSKNTETPPGNVIKKAAMVRENIKPLSRQQMRPGAGLHFLV